MKAYRYILYSLMMGLFACEETILLDLDQAPSKIVIEGMLTNREKDQYVRITRTVGFYSSASPEKVINARVSVTSSEGEIVNFVQVSPGYYVPANSYAGKIGNRYKLSVRIGTVIYESEDQLLRVAPIDSIGYRPVQNPSDKEIKSGHTNELLLYFKEPPETDDFYMFKFYRNDSLTYDSQNDIYVISDEGLADSILGFPGPVNYALGDSARMEMFSLSRNGYLYYSDLTNLLFSDGGLFGPVPANPRSNISNGALGFFQVSAVTTAEVIIKKE